MKTFKEELQQRTETINRELMRFLPEEKGMQKLILEACNYSVENGGKRIRPLLMESAYFLCRLSREPEACGQAGEPEALRERWREEYETLLAPFMAAIEMIHSSSLVHDDLPCMDNDRLRRGKPSTWARFGEDMGTLAGDGLMIYAFETAVKAMDLRETKLLSASAESREAASMMIRNYTEQAGNRACRVINGVDILARKTGIFGMIGGQTVDVQLTGKTPSEEELSFIYRLKTGALLEAAMMIGGVLAGYAINPLITLGAGAVGFFAGWGWRHLPARTDGLRLAGGILLGHIVGSMILNSLALRLFYGYAWAVLAARIPNALVLAGAEFVLVRVLLANHALMEAARGGRTGRRS